MSLWHVVARPSWQAERICGPVSATFELSTKLTCGPRMRCIPIHADHAAFFSIAESSSKRAHQLRPRSCSYLIECKSPRRCSQAGQSAGARPTILANVAGTAETSRWAVRALADCNLGVSTAFDSSLSHAESHWSSSALLTGSEDSPRLTVLGGDGLQELSTSYHGSSSNGKFHPPSEWCATSKETALP